MTQLAQWEAGHFDEERRRRGGHKRAFSFSNDRPRVVRFRPSPISKKPPSQRSLRAVLRLIGYLVQLKRTPPSFQPPCWSAASEPPMRPPSARSIAIATATHSSIRTPRRVSCTTSVPTRAVSTMRPSRTRFPSAAGTQGHFRCEGTDPPFQSCPNDDRSDGAPDGRVRRAPRSSRPMPVPYGPVAGTGAICAARVHQMPAQPGTRHL